MQVCFAFLLKSLSKTYDCRLSHYKPLTIIAKFSTILCILCRLVPTWQLLQSFEQQRALCTDRQLVWSILFCLWFPNRSAWPPWIIRYLGPPCSMPLRRPFVPGQCRMNLTVSFVIGWISREYKKQAVSAREESESVKSSPERYERHLWVALEPEEDLWWFLNQSTDLFWFFDSRYIFAFWFYFSDFIWLMFFSLINFGQDFGKDDLWYSESISWLKHACGCLLMFPPS